MATIRQKKAFKKMSENVGKKSLGKVLREAGYSESVSRSPSRVTNTKGWKELMDSYFPDKALLKLHKKLLEKQEIISHQGQFVKTGQPHSDVKYALELIYKLKGRYTDDPNHIDKSGRLLVERMTAEERKIKRKELEEEHKLLYQRLKKFGRQKKEVTS